MDRFVCLAHCCAQLETVVLEGDSVAEALVRYAAESGVRSLVVGSQTASLTWLRR
jgi:nucleotide-binding universal stress UspA family protein